MSDVIEILIKGGPVMVPLILCSIVSLAITIERFVFWNRIKSEAPVEEMLRLVESQELTQALQLGRESRAPVARVLAAGLLHRNPSLTILQRR